MRAVDALEISPDEVDTGIMEAFLIQDGSYVDARSDDMVEEFGSVEDQIKNGLGLGVAELSHLECELLE